MDKKQDFKIHKKDGFTVMLNNHLREENISLKAIGLLSKMLSLPKDWDYSISGLVKICKDGETSVRSALKELEKFGYLKIEKIKPQKGNSTFSYIYHIFEEPQGGGFLGVENQDLENLDVESLDVENQGQLNTNILNTKELNTKDKRYMGKTQKFIKPTVEEIKAYCDDRKNNVDPLRFYDFYESKGWYVGKNKMKDWKACVRTWERNSNDKPKEIKDNPYEGL